MSDLIAVVDDDSINLQLAERFLGKNDFRVIKYNSGREFVDRVSDGEIPDLVLLDIMMPEMDGFETLRRLKELITQKGLKEIPVVFMTADDDNVTETRGLAAGALDFVRKPFVAEVLVQRVRNVITQTRRMQELAKYSETDHLTELLNKDGVTDLLRRVCTAESGALIVVDLDGFKLVNDIYGHDMGDRVLAGFADILRRNVRQDDIVGRVGGDEFIVFCKGERSLQAVKDLAKRLNELIIGDARKLLGMDMKVPIGVSAGSVFVPDSGTEYEELFRYADRALYYVKNNGKHGCALYEEIEKDSGNTSGDITTLSMAMAERTSIRHAMWIGEETFRDVYQYMMRYIQSYSGVAYKALFTLSPGEGTVLDEKEYVGLYHEFGELVQNTLRKSDVMMQNSKNQYFLLLPELEEKNSRLVMERIMKMWKDHPGAGLIRVHYDLQMVEPEKAQEIRRIRDTQDRSDKNKTGQPMVVVVDDDTINRKTAGRILSKSNMEVETFESGELLIKYIEAGNRPELVLLDILMPDMDGFETIERLRRVEKSLNMEPTPVIFLTANEDEEAETKGLKAGAMDFIRKPFVPDVLSMRVRHIIDLVALQRNLSDEVSKKTRENEALSIQVVLAIADAIDAKDTYTNGHSRRVADYARMIAARYGYDSDKQSDIYMMGLLHDVGKIGVPDAVINKPDRLNDEEFSLIKEHPVMGARILENIKAMPQLVIGARWHHEKFAGGGYPDGISGFDIPEQARIIAVADAYDAMTSRRSYRNALPQEKVRAEIAKGSGTQFDPAFADIMLRMIDEDKDYKLREF
ncbi:MAG: response regulator [Lachnospiraceae bacterium]|nr:response regulator [Lachnospiraceae bacterium]